MAPAIGSSVRESPAHGLHSVDEGEGLGEVVSLDVAQRLCGIDAGPNLRRAALGDAEEMDAIFADPPPALAEIQRN